MAYSHKSNKSGATYYLHSKETESRGGKRTLFFFSKEIKNGEGTVALDKVPDGYTVTESSQTGLPLLKKAAGDGEKAETPAAPKAKAAASKAKK